ncbi:protein-L-isoaspartate O-methyltransferase family protein [Novosphingobium rosa]|uniref:protein-L-isoaspartate O-methyltransferase family protein n=1 Tax=Novosphingobium rosa TaxID=76978 RepID=UPI00082A9BE0|nr:protein-L-isoaspartate O-methyltransferase [Novosphingobium rosa]
MGYLAEAIAVARRTRPKGAMPVDLWDEKTLMEWLISAPQAWGEQRKQMIAAIRARLLAMKTISPQAIERTMAAMAKVPRECFMPEPIEDLAYLPMVHGIGLEQTISHPEIVALLAAAGDPRGGSVLDVGTGSGYQAAVMAGMARHVISMEIIGDHACLAGDRLKTLGYTNIEVLTGDAGATGRFAPETFDAIVVAAGAATIPHGLQAALKVGGRLVMPVGPSQDQEHMILLERLAPDTYRQTVLRPVRFVPLTGEGMRQPPGAPATEAQEQAATLMEKPEL